MRSGSMWLGAGLLLVLGSAQAVTFRECILADGSKVFTDGACPAGAKSVERELADPKVPAAVTPPPAVPVAPGTPDAMTAAAPPPPPKLQNRYRCIRPEGGDYVSNYDNKETRWVPLWTVERPNLVLDSGGSQVRVGTAPAGTRGKGDPRREARGEAGSNLVLVRDQCLPLVGRELCTYIKTERNRLSGEIDRAFEDTRADLERQAQELDQEFVLRCRP